MTSPPCQSFSLAGKRKGEEDKRGLLFYNSHEFIVKNNPRYFIFENVKGLLSDSGGKTFNRWVNFLGGKSVNGTPVIFPLSESVPYHIYHKVLNAKNYGVPQNRERVFIIGIRDDVDNTFRWPKEERLEKRLKDVLESEVDGKYYLSDKMIDYLTNVNGKHEFLGNDFNFKPRDVQKHASCITARCFKQGCDDNYIQEEPKLIKVGSLYENNSEAGRIYDPKGISTTIKSEGGGLGAKTGLYKIEEPKIGAMTGRNPNNPKSRGNGLPTEQQLEINENGTSNCITTVQKDNLVIYQRGRGFNKGGAHEICPPITSSSFEHNHTVNRIRRLTPRECFRLMDFPESFDFSCVSDTQAYKQAGNSIVVGVLEKILYKLNLQN